MNFSGDKLYISKRNKIFARTKDIHSFPTSGLNQSCWSIKRHPFQSPKTTWWPVEWSAQLDFNYSHEPHWKQKRIICKVWTERLIAKRAASSELWLGWMRNQEAPPKSPQHSDLQVEVNIISPGAQWSLTARARRERNDTRCQWHHRHVAFNVLTKMPPQEGTWGIPAAVEPPLNSGMAEESLRHFMLMTSAL